MLRAMPPPLRPTRERTWIYILVILACGVGFGWHVVGLEAEVADLVRAEDAAKATVGEVFEAQKRHRTHTGQFGTLAELATGGELTGVEVVEDEDAAPGFVRHGYRFELLLPDSKSGEGHLRMIRDLDREGRPSVSLRKHHHMIVARPVEPGQTGFRILYMDEAGDLWVSEGVSDEAQRNVNPLPRAHLATTGAKNPLGLVWMKWADIEARWAGSKK